LPIKQNDSKLRSTRSEENLTLPINNYQPISPIGPIGCYLNCETQSLDAELIDSYRSYINSEDADIWSTSDEINGDEQQQQQQQQHHQHQHHQPTQATLHPISRRNGLLGYRSQVSMNNVNQLDSQSIRSIESHLSQQEIMPSDIRKRLSEVQTTGPILFDVGRRIVYCCA
jgi:hypothetical protein